MEEQEDGCLTVLEKNGLGPPEAILENYGIDSETDLLLTCLCSTKMLSANWLLEV